MRSDVSVTFEPTPNQTQICYSRRLPCETRSLVLFQRFLRLLHSFRKWPPGEGLKVEQACVSPPDRVALLNLKLLCNFRKSLWINCARERLPMLARRTHPVNATLIVQR